MQLPWIQVSFEGYDGIRIPYMKKRVGACMAGLTCLMLVRDWKK